MRVGSPQTSRRCARLIVGLLAFLIAWEIFSRTGCFGRFPQRAIGVFLPSPLSVIKCFLQLLTDGQLLHHISVSLCRVGIGFFMSVVIGVPVGYFMGKSRAAFEYLDPFVQIFQSIPGVAWVPLAIVWFGLGDRAAVFIIVMGSIFPVILNTVQGVESIDRNLVSAALTLGARRRHLILMVELPSVLPYMITGFRTGLGFAWRVVLAAEMVGVPSGLGYLLTFGRGIGRTDITIVTMACLGMIMLVTNHALLSPLEQWINAHRRAADGSLH